MPIYVTEYEAVARDRFSGSIVAPMSPPVVAQDGITLGGNSAVFNDRTAFIEVHCSEAACIAIGSGVTAAGAKQRMAAGETRYYGVKSGWRLSTATPT